MKFNLWKWCVLVVVVLAGRQTAVFAYDGAPSDSTLSEMGLSGLEVMSDDEAMTVRGEGFGSGSSASAWGSSFANVETPFGSAGSENSYDAHGKHSASGSNDSFAGFEITTSGGDDEHHGKPPKDHGDKGHGDKDHGDKGHGDKGHGDKGHGDKGHGDKGHGDKGHGDKSHGDKGHGDKSHGDKGGNGGYGMGGGNSGKGHDKGNGGGGYGGGGDKGGHKGGSAPKTVSKVVFAGGSSQAHAH